MGSIFWLLGPLAGIVFVVFGYGFLGVISSDQCSWADYLFWSIMNRDYVSKENRRFQPTVHV